MADWIPGHKWSCRDECGKNQFYSFRSSQCNKRNIEHQRIIFVQAHKNSLNTENRIWHHILRKRIPSIYQGVKLIIVIYIYIYTYIATILTLYSPTIQYLKIISYFTQVHCVSITYIILYCSRKYCQFLPILRIAWNTRRLWCQNADISNLQHMVLYSKQYAWLSYVNSIFTSVRGPLKCKHIFKWSSLKD
jgi:hypothetical protein